MEKKTFWDQIKSFRYRFWMVNLVEFLERFSYYCMRSVLGIYIVTPAKNGGLDLSQTQKGNIFALWALVQCLLPIFSGGISDRYGYKKSICVSFALNAIGLVLMGVAQEYWTFVLSCVLVAIGCGTFKPPIQAILSGNLDKENASVGWGIFYISVNIGGFLAPFLASFARAHSWQYVFFCSAGLILLAYPCLFFLESPKKEKESQKSIKQVVLDLGGLARNIPFVCFLVIYSIFYIVFMQIWDTSPIFIDQWVESNHIISWMGQITGIEFLQKTAREGTQIPAELMLNINTFVIILFAMPVAFLFGKLKHLQSMIFGMFFCAASLLLCGFSREGVWCLLGIALFSIGEIACSPKFSEYVSFLAPENKKALYLGFAQVPFAFGWAAGSVFTGWISDRYSDIYALSARYLTTVLNVMPEQIQKIPRGEWLKTLAEHLKISIPEAKALLWNTYYPPKVWYIMAGIGLLSIVAMILYDRKMKQKKINM